MMAVSSRAKSAHGTLSGSEKVAVLLLALGKTRAAKLLKKFEPDELKQLTRSAAELRPVGMSDLATLVEEFAQKFSNGVSFSGTVTEVRDLLSGVMTEEQLAEVLSEAPPREDPVWERVSTLTAESLRGFFGKEHPQTIAFILSRIDSALAAKIIATFAGDVRNGVLCRMITIGSVADDAVRAVEGVLREDLLAASTASSHIGIADILNRLDKSQSEEVLKSLAEVRPDEVKALKSLLFTFEDVAKLSAPARTLVLDLVPIDRLVVALKGTEPDFQATILSALASRSRRMVEAELQSGSMPSQRDLADARRTVVDTVLRMIAKGEIQVETAGEGEAESAA
jgi:flagellar motor switch protein FliG